LKTNYNYSRARFIVNYNLLYFFRSLTVKFNRIFLDLKFAPFHGGAICAASGSQRQRQQRALLSRDESDRLAPRARVAVLDGEALSSIERGDRWLGKANRALDGQRPLDLLATDAGTRLVEDVLGHVEHGVFG